MWCYLFTSKSYKLTSEIKVGMNDKFYDAMPPTNSDRRPVVLKRGPGRGAGMTRKNPSPKKEIYEPCEHGLAHSRMLKRKKTPNTRKVIILANIIVNKL